MRESFLYDKLQDNKVKCNVCAIRCIIPDGKRGACLTRLNRDGTLYTLIYSEVASAVVDPIEKKPLYHFYPGTNILSMGTLGCNFRCPGCQNWEISHNSPDELGKNMEKLEPEDVIKHAKRLNCRSICWTYNDPTIWVEYTYDCMRLAKKNNILTAYITNGYATEEQLELISPFLDAWRVDIKGFSRESYKKVTGLARWECILEIAKLAKFKYNMHVECVTNVTPTLNDSEKILRGIARWIKHDLGEFTPWHVTRFYPYLDLSHIPPTPIKTLERAYEIGREEGLEYVYVGNLPGHRWEDTYCHNCGKVIIKRRGFAIAQALIKNGLCPYCKTQIPGRWDNEVQTSSGERIPVVHAEFDLPYQEKH